MRIVALDELRELIDMPAAIAAVRQGFIDMANGLIDQPEPMQFLFPGAVGELLGDCHIKGAKAKGRPWFVVKLATGFYRNPYRGLPVNDGLVLVLSSETGRPVAIRAETGISRLIVKGRSPESMRTYVTDMEEKGFTVSVASTGRDLCHAADIVVTTTPATSPVLHADDLTDRLHIVAVGADSPGKIELAPEVLARAAIIATDNHAQCLHHGDFGAAVRAGCVSDMADLSLCDILAGKSEGANFADASLSVVDLTGLGVQDLAIASAVASSLGEP
ncbi:hypothetical protein [uncultured Ruegeria sp.]|uniref:hypothetical protein n=1 Tax=uncultured Ruegeria sp. TaxID=259304 RepID=UPI002604FB18|nr:hypothetical protein [uncultured Ruegeria sp.]